MSFNPLTYLGLQTESGATILRREIIWVIGLALIFTAPFIILPTANYFHNGGLVDRIGAFSSILTGFYVAGLVAVASMSMNKDDLDKTISVGRVFLKRKDGTSIGLTRRQFVCYMFGYLAFMSLVITLMSIMVTVLSEPLSQSLPLVCYVDQVCPSVTLSRQILIFIYLVFVASLTVTTIRALHYLVERLYFSSSRVTEPMDDGQETPK